MTLDEDAHVTLVRAGWFPGRFVDIDPWITLLRREGIEAHDAARAFLREFGGLDVDQSGRGPSRARESFTLDPSACVGEGDRFLEWSAELHRQIVPVGELDRRFFLGLDEESELYVVELWAATFGRMPDAMNRLVGGVMPTEVGGR